MSQVKKTVTFCTIGVGMVVILAAVIGVRALTAANLSKARKIAVSLQATVASHPNPVVASPAAVVPVASAKSVAGVSTHGTAGSPRVVAPSAPAVSSAPAPGAAAAGSTSAAGSSTATGAARATPPVTSGAKAPVEATTPRTVPTSAEVLDAISAVHAIVPFFTPSPADIATAGNDVCTALDQGGTLAQVQAAALNMVGASAYASFIPSGDTQVAIQTLVALYCPGYASRVA